MNVMTHLAGRLFNTPLMIAHAKLDTVLAVIRPKLRGEFLPSPDQVLSKDYAVMPDGIAVIPIFGTLVRRSFGMMAQSGLTSYADISTQFSAAMSDSRVRGILLDIDSPGGEAGGVFDLAQQIYAARGVKPIWALANEEAFSSAYLIAAAADKIFLPRTGGVGSIGVIAMHLDQSQADQEDGLVYTAIYAGDHKNDFSPHAPLSDPARAALQSEVDRVYDMFVSAVARMRGTSADAVIATQAGLFFGETAMAQGLADDIGTFADVAGRFPQRLAQKKTSFINPHQKKEKSVMDTSTQPDPAMQENPPDLAAIRAEASAEAQKQAMAYVTEVTELCQLAGQSEKAPSFIAKAMKPEDVRKVLLEARVVAAEAKTIAGHIPATADASEPKINTAAIYASRNNPTKG